MKILYLIILLLFSFLSYSQEISYVNAKSGLKVRAKPDLNAKKIGKFNYSQEVKILKKTGIKLSVNDSGGKINGEWLKVSAFQQDSFITGYIFDGFLTNKIISIPFNIESFDEFPIEIDGAACYYSLSKDDFETGKYVFANNYSKSSFIKVDGNFKKLRLEKSSMNFGQWINSNFKIFIKTKNIGRVDYTVQTKGKMILISNEGIVLEFNIWGECGC